MSYTALRRLQVQVPEAAKWSNPGLWVKRGIIKKDDGTPFNEIPKRAPTPPRAIAPEEIRAVKEERQILRDAGVDTSELRTDFPPADETNIGPGKDQISMADETPAVGEEEEEAPASTLAAASTAADPMTELLALKRNELVKIADDMGVKYDVRDNKQTLVDLILKAAG
jgi:hypothetical protein